MHSLVFAPSNCELEMSEVSVPKHSPINLQRLMMLDFDIFG